MQEVSRARSTKRHHAGRNPRLKDPFGKERIHLEPLNPNYVVGFIDGEGSFSVSIMRNKTLRNGTEVRAEFEIELRADDREILERIVKTIGAGRIYDCSYERYGWYPHSKLKISNIKDLKEFLVPFLDKHSLQAKKKIVFGHFLEIILLISQKEHLTLVGIKKIESLRNKMRKLGKKHNSKMETARIRENRSSGGVGQ